jgi:hypothetical protein
LRVFWREQHPEGHEQRALSFASSVPALQRVPLFDDLRK